MKPCEINADGKPDCYQVERLEKILSEMPSEEDIQKNADTIKALADPTRLKIIYLLKHGELCVCEIMTALEQTTTDNIPSFKPFKKCRFIKMA